MGILNDKNIMLIGLKGERGEKGDNGSSIINVEFIEERGYEYVYKQVLDDGKEFVFIIPKVELENSNVKNGAGAGSIIIIDKADIGKSDEDRRVSKATGRCAIAFGRYCEENGDYSFVSGYLNIVNSKYSSVIGRECTTDENSDYSYVNGSKCSAHAPYVFVVGESNNASGEASHIYGKYCKTHGLWSRAGGYQCEAKNEGSIAEGYRCKSEAGYARAYGADSVADGPGAMAYGYQTTASGGYSVAGGFKSQSGEKKDDGNTFWYEFCHGYGVKALGLGQAAFGKYNALTDNTNRLLYVGNGDKDTDRRNAFSVTQYGDIIYSGQAVANGADYAEYFEWEDGNLENEDRVGYFVTLTDDGKIKKAENGDDILGIVSASPSVTGNAFEDEWQGKYLTDEWGRKLYETVTYPTKYDEDGNIIVSGYTTKVPMINPDYDATVEYTPRSKRKEWCVVGLLGRLKVRVNSSVGKYVQCGNNGIGVSSSDGFKVLKKISNNIVEVFIK